MFCFKIEKPVQLPQLDPSTHTLVKYCQKTKTDDISHVQLDNR